MARATKPGTRLHYLEVQLEEERAAFHAAQVAEQEARQEADELRAENEQLREYGLQAASELGTLTAENERLRETIAEWQEIHGTFTGEVHAACQAEIERLRTALEQISRESGQVCPDFETCSHGPCQGSLAGKLLALEALATPASGR